MGKLVLISVMAIGLVFVWVRAKWAISKNRRQTNKLVNGLRNREFGVRDLATSLNVIILRKPIDADMDMAALAPKLTQLTGKSLESRFTISYAVAERDGHSAVIAEAHVKSYLESGEFSKSTVLHYPCWFYLQPDMRNAEWKFFSVMPVDEEHKHAMEDFAKWLNNYITTTNS